jgi:septal ring factor EnvC (AmiA/AmiB activator)
MPELLGLLVVVLALAASLWLSYSALTQLRQLRHELDQSQQQGNETRAALVQVRQEHDHVRQDLDQALQELSDLKAAAEVVPPPPPPLPRARSSGLDDLREQLRAAHREADPPSED